MKLRLLLTQDCERACPGCCNKDWDLEALPVCKDYTGYDRIMLTGGEPTLHMEKVFDAVKKIRAQTETRIIMYTANTQEILKILAVLPIIDGITMTLHDKWDVRNFQYLNDHLNSFSEVIYEQYFGSLRLNVFRGVDVSSLDLNLWIVKDNIEWMKNCPLPKDEVFMKFDRG